MRLKPLIMVIRILPSDSKRSHGSFSDVVVDFDPAIVHVDAQSCPSRQGISHRLGQPLLLWQSWERGFDPDLELVQNRPGMVLAQGVPLVSRHASDTVLDIVENADTRQRFLSDRRWLQLDHIMELAPHMRHAGGFDDLVAVEFLVAAITVGMHDAVEACQVVSRMRAFSIRTVVIGDGCGIGGLIATAIKDVVDPDPAGFVLPRPGVENIDRGIVRMYSVECCDMGPDQQNEWCQQSGYAADSVGHHGSGDVYPQPVVHLG